MAAHVTRLVSGIEHRALISGDPLHAERSTCVLRIVDFLMVAVCAAAVCLYKSRRIAFQAGLVVPFGANTLATIGGAFFELIVRKWPNAQGTGLGVSVIIRISFLTTAQERRLRCGVCE